MNEKKEIIRQSRRNIAKTYNKIRENFPLRFLFERGENVHYCREKLLRIFENWLKAQLYKAKYNVFQKLKTLTRKYEIQKEKKLKAAVKVKQILTDLDNQFYIGLHKYSYNKIKTIYNFYKKYTKTAMAIRIQVQ